MLWLRISDLLRKTQNKLGERGFRVIFLLILEFKVILNPKNPEKSRMHVKIDGNHSGSPF